MESEMRNITYAEWTQYQIDKVGIGFMIEKEYFRKDDYDVITVRDTTKAIIDILKISPCFLNVINFRVANKNNS